MDFREEIKYTIIVIKILKYSFYNSAIQIIDFFLLYLFGWE